MHPSLSRGPHRPAEAYLFVKDVLDEMTAPQAASYFLTPPDLDGAAELVVAGTDGIETRWLFPLNVAQFVGDLAVSTGRTAWTGRARRPA